VDRRLPRSSSRGSEKGSPSAFRLFNAVIVIRWLSLAVASIGYLWNLASPQLDFGHFVPACAAAVVYTVLLSLFSRSVYRIHSHSMFFLAADYTFSLILLASTGTVWSPFTMFCACSALFAGGRGNVRAGVAGGLGLVAIFAAALWSKGLTMAALAASDGLELALMYAIEFIVFSVAWAYASGLVADLDIAYSDLSASRDAVSQTNAILDDRRRELLAISRIRAAILNSPHAEEIIGTVLRALESMGFAEGKVFLVQDGALVAFPPDQPARTIDPESDDPVAVAVRLHEKVTVREEAAFASEGGPRPGVVIPIVFDDEAYGALVVGEEQGHAFEAETVELLGLFADELALALQHIRMYEQACEYALVEERNRVAVELNDTVVAKLQAAEEYARTVQAQDVPPDVARTLALLEETMHKALEDLGLAVLNWSSLEWDDRPGDLADRYAGEFTVLSGIPVELTVSGVERPLGAAKAKDLLRVLQESLSNAWRHASTPSVRVALDFDDDGVAMVVSDTGRGYDPAVVAHGAGIGLKSMSERGRRHGGSVDVTSAPGEGTQVRMWMPW
jgi:signal transduction histidine kinase